MKMKLVVVNGIELSNISLFRVLGDKYDRVDVDFPLNSPFIGIEIAKSHRENPSGSYIEIFENGVPILHSNDIRIIENEIGDSQGKLSERITIGLTASICTGARPQEEE